MYISNIYGGAGGHIFTDTATTSCEGGDAEAVWGALNFTGGIYKHGFTSNNIVNGTGCGMRTFSLYFPLL